MGAVSRRYNERDLCPLIVKAAWWYRLSSQTRSRIVAALPSNEPPTFLYVGAVQDALIAQGQRRLMGTFMRAMQEGYDAELAEQPVPDDDVVREIMGAATLAVEPSPPDGGITRTPFEQTG